MNTAKHLFFLLCFPPLFGKITSYCYRSLANLSRLLIACIIYFQLTYRPRVALFDVGRLLSYNLYPFGILFQYVNFACAIPLNCDAKVQTYLQTCKHFPEKVCIFNLLQQIRLFLPKFIHILSTKTGKCAMFQTNIFVCGCNTRVHYIITNNNAIFVAVRSVVLQLICSRINVDYIQKHHHYKTGYLCQITTTTKV